MTTELTTTDREKLLAELLADYEGGLYATLRNEVIHDKIREYREKLEDMSDEELLGEDCVGEIEELLADIEDDLNGMSNEELLGDSHNPRQKLQEYLEQLDAVLTT